MEDKIQSYRQPLITATGIILGFLLNVISVWATNAFSVRRFKEVVIAIGLYTGILLLLIVLYRTLNMNYPQEKAKAYYTKTLNYFIIALGIVFLSLVIVMVESYILNR